MKNLKTILWSTYLILILLLILLFLLKNCNGNQHHPTPRPYNEDTTHIDPIDPDPTPIDTTAVDTFHTDQELIDRANQVGNTGNMKITLMWDFYADIDLHVVQPNGFRLFYKQRNDPSTGGILDTDNRRGGAGAAENIYWQNPPKGKYNVYIQYYDASFGSGLMESGECRVYIKTGDREQIFRINLSPNTKGQNQYIETIEIT